MVSFDVNVEGLQRTLEELDKLERQYTTDDTWVVGTAVNYSIFVEFGTSKMDPRPFFRPAVAAYRANLRAAIAADTETTLEAIESADELVATIAFGLERRIKRIITQLGLIDTGAMRASVAAVRTRGELKTRGDVAARSDVDLDPADFEGAA